MTTVCVCVSDIHKAMGSMYIHDTSTLCKLECVGWCSFNSENGLTITGFHYIS